MQKAKQRSEIAQQDKWRIEDIYATDEAWEADYNECIRRAKEKCAYQGRLAESALILYQALRNPMKRICLWSMYTCMHL